MESRCVGVLGGGQLGRMMAEAGHRLGIKVIALDPLGSASPTGQVAPGCHEGDFKDEQTVKEFAKHVDLLTVEIEHVNADALKAVEDMGVPVQPPAETIALIQDKFKQKNHFQERGVSLSAFMETPDRDAVVTACKAYGFPLMLKSKRLAYDGKGNAVVHNEAEIDTALSSLPHHDVYAEKWVPYARELAVMVVRDVHGSVVAYPVVETRQKDNICHTVVCPAQTSDHVLTKAKEVARHAVSTLKGAGIFGVELFELSDGTIFLNEVAPRPHNSGHYTIEGCTVDQFEMHLRAILGLPLPEPQLQVGAAAMVNVLGTGDAASTKEHLLRALAVPGARLHWYGKAQDKKGRKMGHITITADTMSGLQERIAMLYDGQDEAAAAVSLAPHVGIIMGSDSDLPTMRAAADMLEELGVPFELTIVSAHRTPDRMAEYAKTAMARGLRVIIAGAGGAAHLPGMVAAMTPLPVIGVPVKTSTLSGVDSLYSIVQMPRGIPVATVAIGNAKNAGLLAVRMLVSTDRALLMRLQDWQQHQEQEVLDKAARLEDIGYKQYLDSTATREVK